LPLDRLTVGQHGLRYTAGDIHRMMDFVADGGIWTETALRQYADRHGLPAPSLIQLSEFPAPSGEVALLLIHDGHHRLVATHLAGRDFLHAGEYQVTRWSYEEYLAINFRCGWVTPFDPRTHARKADFGAWKARVLEVAQTDLAEAERMIRDEAAAYRERRRYSAIGALSQDCCSLELDRWTKMRQRRHSQGKGLDESG
jgi:hypothetical protein